MARLFVEHLTVIDCAFLDAQRGLVGESWIVDLELEGELDDQGMVLDFGEVKRKLKKAIDSVADHRLLVPSRSSALDFALSAAGTGLSFRAATGAIEHIGPQKSVCNIDAEVVDEGSVARQIEPWLAKAVPPSVSRVTVALRPERIDGAYYHYTHGLKKHEGQCQRIAHGHRSRLQVRVGGRRDERLERQWADRWRDIYLGTAADIVSHGKGRIRFEYKSGEGEFALELPAERADLLQTDSTVECIAEHIAGQVAAERPGTRVEVRAYEGVMKGAIATRT
ncbi:MAG TPA: 6-carboxytetrahydropterin synthase [Verrucomicrobiae bacterium]|nr:6-carboxytetrahydropterin synthase [Verrucomicrobiae bacterium]